MLGTSVGKTRRTSSVAEVTANATAAIIHEEDEEVWHSCYEVGPCPNALLFVSAHYIRPEEYVTVTRDDWIKSSMVVDMSSFCSVCLSL